jgi:hypothetical protein
MRKVFYQYSLSENICAFILYCYIFELVFGGAIGFSLIGLSLRKILILLIIVFYLVSLTSNLKFDISQFYFLLGLLLFVLIWAGLIPLLNSIKYLLTIEEIFPVLSLILVFPIMLSININGLKRYIDFLNFCVAVIGCVVILSWAMASFFAAPEIAFIIKVFYLTVSGSDFGMYIGPMPDGSFRVMWISCIFFPFMLIYKNFDRVNIPWTIFYSIAIYATGTRIFIIVGILIIFMQLLKKRLFLAITILFILLSLTVWISSYIDNFRLFQLAEDFSEASPRLKQFYSLIDLFYQHPFWGAGFGANADVIRSYLAPFSYELTYVALLAKIGIIGAIFLLIAFLALIIKIILLHKNYRLNIILIVASFIFITASNPYLINLVGMFILSLIIAVSLISTSGALQVEPRIG